MIPKFVYVGGSEQPTDMLVKVSLATEVEVDAITTPSTSPYIDWFDHETGNVWHHERTTYILYEHVGFTTSIENSYDFSSNADVNVANAISGFWLDKVNQQFYLGNWQAGSKQVVRMEAPYATTTDAIVDVSAVAAVPTGFTFDLEGNLLVADFTAEEVHKFVGFSSTFDETMSLDSATGQVYGIHMGLDGRLYVARWPGGFGNGNPCIEIYDGFNGSLLTRIQAEDSSNWDGAGIQGIAVEFGPGGPRVGTGGNLFGRRRGQAHKFKHLDLVRGR